MAILRVWTHWTDFGGTAPPQLTTALTGGAPPYSGGVPTIGFPPTPCPSKPTGPTGLPYPVWAELASQADINTVNWGGRAWPGPPPPFWPTSTGVPRAATAGDCVRDR
jgi:hypothetical protein